MAKKNHELEELQIEVDSMRLQLEKASSVIIEAFGILCPGQKFTNLDSLLVGAKTAKYALAKAAKKEDALKEIRKAKDIRTRQIQDNYDLGFFNGLELALALLEDRTPKYLGRESLDNKQS